MAKKQHAVILHALIDLAGGVMSYRLACGDRPDQSASEQLRMNLGLST